MQPGFHHSMAAVPQAEGRDTKQILRSLRSHQDDKRFAALNASPRASVARARKPVTLATANETPERLFSRKTFGIGLGNGAAS